MREDIYYQLKLLMNITSKVLKMRGNKVQREAEPKMGKVRE